MHEQFRGHKGFDYTEEFCAKYDGPTFDPGFTSEPLVRQVFAPVKNSIYVPKDKL